MRRDPFLGRTISRSNQSQSAPQVLGRAPGRASLCGHPFTEMPIDADPSPLVMMASLVSSSSGDFTHGNWRNICRSNSLLMTVSPARPIQITSEMVGALPLKQAK